MKITKQNLRQIIKEELSKVLNEASPVDGLIAKAKLGEVDPSDVGFEIERAFKNGQISIEDAIAAINKLKFGDDPNFTDVQHKEYFIGRLHRAEKEKEAFA